jgi:glycosyltransferase involved in cell wall biosynthesis
MPVYNSEEYLSESVRSILAQSEQSLELIVVDDGSSDSSLQLLRQFANKDPRVKVFSQTNSGVSAARNTGLQFARGKWVAFADSDDWLDPDTIRHWLSYGEAEDLELLIGNGFVFSNNPAAVAEAGREPIVQRVFSPETVVSGRDWLVACVEANEWPHYVWLQFVRRDLIECKALKFESGVVHEDILWTMELALCVSRVGFRREPRYAYRINPKSIMGNDSPAAVEKRAQGYIAVLARMVEAANQSADLPLRKALLRQVNREAGHFFALLRKRLKGATVRQGLAQSFVRAGLLRAMFSGARDAGEYWRAIRCWAGLKRLG